MLDRPGPSGCLRQRLTAARLMQTLIGLGVRIPDEVHIVGMDDVKYAVSAGAAYNIHQNSRKLALLPCRR